MHSTALTLQADACFESLRELDRELTRLARKSGSLRFALGLGLDALARTGGHADLGFPSIEDYGHERCERRRTWIRTSCTLARRVNQLPRFRYALISGRISWSMAEALVPSATLDNEAHLLQLAAGSTVARVKQLLRAQQSQSADDPLTEPEDEPRCTLTLTENHEDALLFECAHRLARHLGASTMNDVVDALIGEARSSLIPLIPKDAAAPSDLAPSLDAQNAYIRQRNEWRDEAERICEPRIPAWPANDVDSTLDDLPDFSGDPASIDASLRSIAAALHDRDLAIGELAERFWNADGWRRLGYATARQYARERLGMCVSSVKDKRQLACKLRELPHLARAFRERVIGYEAARLVARIATPETDDAWTDRAAFRTLVHLREDLDAAGLLARVAQKENPAPPPDDVVADLKALEARVITGAVFQETGQKSVTETVAAIEAAFHAARHTPRPLRALGRDTLRLRVEPEIRAAYRGLERLYERHQPCAMTFLRFACQSLIDTHVHELPKVAYAQIYARDGLRCMNPFCTRRDCTPHHVRFRSQGGDDSDDNVITLCVHCHLEGVHRGRFTVAREGGVLVWRFAHTVVVGRTRYRSPS